MKLRWLVGLFLLWGASISSGAQLHCAIIVTKSSCWKNYDVAVNLIDFATHKVVATYHLAKGKKIAPLGHNYGFDKSFITTWLGDALYNLMFDYHVRDSVIADHKLNDKSYFRNINLRVLNFLNSI